MNAEDLKDLFALGTWPEGEDFESLIDAIFRTVATADITEVAIVRGTIEVEAGESVVEITTKDASDLETITVTADTYYEFVLLNSTGGGVKILDTDNISFGQTTSIADGEFLRVIVKDGNCYLATIPAGVKGLKQVQGVADSSVYIGESAGDGTDETDTANVGIGYYAMKDLDGEQNIGIGQNVGQSAVGSQNIWIGIDAGKNKTEQETLRIGNYRKNAIGIIEGDLDNAERWYTYSTGEQIRHIDFSTDMADDETNTIEITPAVVSLDLTVVQGANIYAARISGTGAALQESWADGAVFDVADTDTKFCAYYSGTDLIIKNRLGDVASVIVSLKYKIASP